MFQTSKKLYRPYYKPASVKNIRDGSETTRRQVLLRKASVDVTQMQENCILRELFLVSSHWAVTTISLFLPNVVSDFPVFWYGSEKQNLIMEQNNCRCSMFPFSHFVQFWERIFHSSTAIPFLRNPIKQY